jgi:hypothetical protein
MLQLAWSADKVVPETLDTILRRVGSSGTAPLLGHLEDEDELDQLCFRVPLANALNDIHLGNFFIVAG